MKIPPKPQHVTWTDEQWQAIHAKGSDILVAAAAGSGKTAVLVERIIQKIIDEKNPVNVDELLVATFTNASAAEMRQRIGQAIEAEIAKNPYSHHLRKQLNLLNHASISTLHAFCLNVVRKYYYLLDIDPGFRIADETEMLLVKDEAVEELLEEEYGKEQNEDFFQVVDIFSDDRSDIKLQELITKLYDFSRANPNPEEWLNDIVQMYDTEDIYSVDELPFIEPLLYDIELHLTEASRFFKETLELANQPGGPLPRKENFESDIAIVDNLFAAKEESFQKLYDEMQKVSFSPLKRIKADEYDPVLVGQTKKLRDQGKKLIQDLKENLFSRKPETFLQDLAEMKKPVATLIQLVDAFAEKFRQRKMEKGIVDFSDLEHLALMILGSWDPVSRTVEPTEVALQYRKQFKEVFIDEYQDTNMVQEMILQLVKKPTASSGNLFMVGDVKQSIYRFRLAEPKLFLQKYLRFQKDGKDSGLRIDLSKNFRSRKEVLDGTNFIFRQIMDPRIGEIEYDEAASLKQGADYPKDRPYPVELSIIYKDGEDENDDIEPDETFSEIPDYFGGEELEQSQMESRYIAKKIRELIDSKEQVYDTKTKRYRPIQYRDIVILFRSFTWAPQFLEELKSFGIPAYAEISTGYFDAAEVSTMVTLLQIIDNPYQDIPLAAVLRSPLVGLAEDEMARIRLIDKRSGYYESAKKFVQKSPDNPNDSHIQERLSGFLSLLENWRSMARHGALSDLIWQIYRDTKFYDFVGGLPGGKQRQANLRALYDRAKQYESTSFRGLFRFLRFIERMRERGNDLGAARALGEQEDVVRIMTIHKSKGLEFPVVFIAGLGRKFNMRDLYHSFLFDKEYGFATHYINADKQITYPSLIHLAVSKKKRLELIAEEMRVLYVAFTRAKEKLYLLASTKNIEKLLDKWQKHGSNQEWLLSDYDRMKCDNYLNWIGPALIRHNNGEIIRKENHSGIVNEEIAHHPSLWRINLYSEKLLRDNTTDDEQDDKNYLDLVKKGEQVPIQTEHKERISFQMSWSYPYEQAAQYRGKQSVSEIKRLREIRDAESGDDLIRPFKNPIADRPKFLQEKKITPAEKGTAMHMVMQHLDISNKPTEDSLKAQLIFMQENELLAAEEAETIDIDSILAFFETEIGKRLIRAQWVKRELPFSYSIPASEIYPDWRGNEEPIFIQGIIDCLFRDEHGFVLLDYKTDQISGRFRNGFEGAKPVLLARYQTQLDLYRRAVEGILKEPLSETYLYFFDGPFLLPVR